MMCQGLTRLGFVLGLLAASATATAQQGKDLRPYMPKAKGQKAPTAQPVEREAPLEDEAPPPARKPVEPPVMPKATYRPAPAPSSAAPVQQAPSAGSMQLMQPGSPAAATTPPTHVIQVPVSPPVRVISTPPPVAAPAQQVVTAVRTPGVSRSETFYPSGDRSTSAILLERSLPGEVRVGEAFQYEIKLSNLTAKEVRDLELAEQMPSGFAMTSTTPSASGGTARWSLGTLAPHQSTAIQVNGSATTVGDLKYCATVTFKTEVCATHRIVQPALQLTVTAPAEVILCDPITLKYVVTNTGTGIARNVKVSHGLASGLTSAEGRTELAFDAGDLGEKQSREFTATVKAGAVGRYTHRATAKEDGGLTAEGSAETNVTVPKLVVTKSGPDMRYLGRPATYEITVSNQGDAVAKDTIVVDDVSAAATLTEASQGGQVMGGKVTWNLGTLAPGATQKVSLTVTATQIGTITNTVSAKAYCAEAGASATTQVLGIPAVLLEVIDNDDPIEVGGQEHYDIVVTNQGSSDGTNIVITATIPAEQEYISATGPTTSQVQGKTVTFAPLPMLPPNAKATFRVTVKGTAVADVRFGVSMTSDQAQVPVSETESTHIY